VLTNTHVPLGPRQAPGHSQNAYYMESFIDELVAYATAQDPYRFFGRCWRTGPFLWSRTQRDRKPVTVRESWHSGSAPPRPDFSTASARS
jgi:hypothetical protein